MTIAKILLYIVAYFLLLIACDYGIPPEYHLRQTQNKYWIRTGIITIAVGVVILACTI